MLLRYTGGSSRLQREGPKPANADVIQAHQVYIGKVRFRKGGANRILALLSLNLARLPPPWIRQCCDMTPKLWREL